MSYFVEAQRKISEENSCKIFLNVKNMEKCFVCSDLLYLHI